MPHHGRRSTRSRVLAAPDPEALTALERGFEVLGEIRRVKSAAKRPAKTRIAVARVRTDAAVIPLLQRIEVDLLCAAGADRIEFERADGLNVELEFASEPTVTGDPPE